MSSALSAAPPTTAPWWDIFCRVIDNHGDLGVCWRLARDLAQRGVAVRLWVDDASALAWMAPDGCAGVQVLPWRDPAPEEVPGEVVVEAFGCDPPAAFVQRMVAKATAPVWINLEYLSAEAYVERSHGLASPQWSGPGAGLTKWFFYPGFTPATGGLLRAPGLLAQRDAVQALDQADRHGERQILLFGYAQPALHALLQALRGDESASCLLVTPGLSAQQVQAGDAAGHLRLRFLAAQPQPDFDRLLWQSDLNLVRGEDSLVSAVWAARPMLWQLYPQDDGAHGIKLEAFLARYLDGAPAALAEPLRQVMRAWNGTAAWDAAAWSALWGPHYPAWCAWAREIASRWALQPDLVSALMAFASRRLK